MKRQEYKFPRNWMIASAIAGTMLIVSSQASLAGPEDQISFREFKALNADLSRHAARQMFRAEHRQQRNSDARLSIQPVIDFANPVSLPETTTQTDALSRQELKRLDRDLTRNRTTQVDNGQTVRLANGLDLDLSSTQRNIVLGRNLFADGATVEITVGRETKTLSAGSMVSAAEYVAVKQALDGEQSVAIDNHGRAIGGNVDLESIASERTNLRASKLVIPADVTTYGDFSRHSEFKLLGDLNNYGTLHAVSSDGSPRSGAIRAVDINNYKGATITSEISDLTLDASGDITNYGSITGSGGVTLSASGFVNNYGTTRARGDVTLQGARIRNSGVVESTANNINLNGSATSTKALVVVNTLGTLQALNGAINLRDASYDGALDTYIVGGDLYSKEVNLFAGQANANLNVGDITGRINQTGLATHIIASTDMLNIGSMCLTGDPTIYNTAGGINIDADVLVGENLVYVATGNITSADNITIQAGDATRGFEINMIAGANFVPDSGGGSGASVGSGARAGASLMAEDCGCLGTGGLGTGGVRLDAKASKTGGAILLGNNVTVSARPTTVGGDQNGDGVLMIAFKGKGATTGLVDLTGTTVLTGGSGTGTNGDFYVLAENTRGTAITTGVIDTTGGSGTTFGKSGTVGLFTVNLISSEKGQDIVYDAVGNRTSSAFITGEILNKTGDIIVTDTAAPTDILADGRLIINAGSLITLNGQAESLRGSAELISNIDIVDGPNAAYKSSLTVFLIAQNIGTALNPVTVEAPDVQSFGLFGKPATSNFVQVVGTGPLSITGNSKGTLSFDAPTRDVIVPSFGFLFGKDVVVNANSVGTLNNVNGSESVSVNLDAGSFVPSTFNGLFTKSLTLSSISGNIGSAATAFTLPTGITTVAASTISGDINIRNVTGESLTFTKLESIAGNVTVNGQSSITLAPSVTAGGRLDVTTSNGTISASGAINATNGISLVNTSTVGKINVAKDTTMNTNAETDGEGDIILSVGTSTDVLAPLPINNVQINDGADTGVVIIFGTGVTASSPVNTLNAQETADVTIMNGTSKASNINLGGNVVITAQ
jgi:filamentous hemagglutinin